MNEFVKSIDTDVPETETVYPEADSCTEFLKTRKSTALAVPAKFSSKLTTIVVPEVLVSAETKVGGATALAVANPVITSVALIVATRTFFKNLPMPLCETGLASKSIISHPSLGKTDARRMLAIRLPA